MQRSKTRFLAFLVLPLLAVSFASAAFFSLSSDAHAQNITNGSAQSDSTFVTGSGETTDSAGSGTTGQTLANPLKFKSLDELLDGILAAVIELGGVILTLALIWTGFKFVAARGNEEKIRSARTALMWTVIGGLILLGATAIKEVITSTVGSITP